MNSFDRLSSTLKYREPDRVPVDLGSSGVTSIASGSLKQLLDYCHIDTGFHSPDIIQGIGTPPDPLKEVLQVDTVRVGLDRIPPDRVPAEIKGMSPWEAVQHNYSLEDPWGIKWEHQDGDLYCRQRSHPLGGDELVLALESYTLPFLDCEETRKAIQRDYKCIGNYYPVFDRDCAGMFEMSQRLRGMENLFMELAADTGTVERLLDMLLEYKLSYWDIVLSANQEIGRSEFVWTEADDFGTDLSLLVSPEMIRGLFLPRMEKLIRFVKGHAPDSRLCFHSCGAIRDIIPDLIGIGVDIINPVQYIATGMALEGLKRDFGKDIVFWGGCVDTTEILPFGTPEEVADEVKRVLDIMAPGGGFVAAAVHNIQADVPVENIISLFGTIREYGNY